MDKKLSRAKRGETSKDFDKKYEKYQNDKLIYNLNDENPQVRTSSAKTLGNRKYIKAIKDLCKRLSIEKALYTKIAISDALGKIGINSLNELLKYVGKIGSNRHDKLPDDIFKKWNYPLPRDIVIRTIIKIGKPALKKLCKFVINADKYFVSELIDAIGHISFYSNDTSSFDVLIKLLNRYKENQIITWKIIRALQAFPYDKSISILKTFLYKSSIPQFRWEAVRSLGQIGSEKCLEILKSFNNEKNMLVNEMINLSLNKITGK